MITQTLRQVPFEHADSSVTTSLVSVEAVGTRIEVRFPICPQTVRLFIFIGSLPSQ